MYLKEKLKWSRYRLGVAQRVGRGIALLYHDGDTRRGWVVSSTPRPLFTPGKDPVLIIQEAGWAPGPVRRGGKSRPHRDSIPDRGQSLYRLSYRAHEYILSKLIKQTIHVFLLTRLYNILLLFYYWLQVSAWICHHQVNIKKKIQKRQFYGIPFIFIKSFYINIGLMKVHSGRN